MRLAFHVAPGTQLHILFTASNSLDGTLVEQVPLVVVEVLVLVPGTWALMSLGVLAVAVAGSRRSMSSACPFWPIQWLAL